MAVVSGMFLLASCGNGSESVEETESAEGTEETAAVDAPAEATYNLDPANSGITWTGTAVGVYSHSGTINFTEGSITIAGDQITGGNFTVDMSSIVPTVDASFNEENTPENLVGHLGSPDFFDLANNSTATLLLKSVDGASAVADLTIRGKIAEVSITDVAVSAEGEGINVSGKLTFDRQVYGASWGFPSGDMVLSDDVELTFEISASK